MISFRQLSWPAFWLSRGFYRTRTPPFATLYCQGLWRCSFNKFGGAVLYSWSSFALCPSGCLAQKAPRAWQCLPHTKPSYRALFRTRPDESQGPGGYHQECGNLTGEVFCHEEWPLEQQNDRPSTKNNN